VVRSSTRLPPTRTLHLEMLSAPTTMRGRQSRWPRTGVSGAWRAMADRANGKVLELRGDYPLASQTFLRAAALFENIGQPYDMARCLVDAARTQTLTSEGQPSDLLGRALAIFQRLQAESDANQIRAQLSRR
jgi:hypothetical protein